MFGLLNGVVDLISNPEQAILFVLGGILTFGIIYHILTS